MSDDFSSEVEVRRAAAPAVTDQLDSWVTVVGTVSLLAQQICDTDFVPKEFRGNPAATTAAMMYGREIGLGPMGALQSVYVIHGKPAIYAEMMRALVLAKGHDLEFTETTNTRVIMRGRRAGSTTWQDASFTFDDAKAQGLLGNANYRTRPQEMLVARCTARLCRRLFADVIHGLWAVEEAEDNAVETVGPVPPDGGPRTSRRATSTRTRKSEAKAIEAPPVVNAAPSPTPDPPPLPGDESEPVAGMSTSGQWTALAAAMAAVGIQDRDERLRTCAALAGRDLGSSKDLTRAEAGQILDALAKAQASDDPGGFLDAVISPPPADPAIVAAAGPPTGEAGGQATSVPPASDVLDVDPDTGETS